MNLIATKYTTTRRTYTVMIDTDKTDPRAYVVYNNRTRKVEYRYTNMHNAFEMVRALNG